jgi:glycosyltransferase involved in cell wall biosynthesis
MSNQDSRQTGGADEFAVSAIIATKGRPVSLRRTLQSLAEQGVQPQEIIVVDASADSDTLSLCEKGIAGLRSQLQWIRAGEPGAAPQRNEGVLIARGQIIWFLDDDVVFENDCVSRLGEPFQRDPQIGGVNAMIRNQCYHSPGLMSRFVFSIMKGESAKTFAGEVIGPAVNLLPEDRDDLPDIVPVEWLNTTCTMYRREALPSPPFDPFFTGYSLMEDVALSAEVGKNWKLVNARTARVFHDSQPGDHKSDDLLLSRMELVNRHHVMTKVLHRSRFRDYLKLAAFEVFGLMSTLLSTRSWRRFWRALEGKRLAVVELLR